MPIPAPAGTRALDIDPDVSVSPMPVTFEANIINEETGRVEHVTVTAAPKSDGPDAVRAGDLRSNLLGATTQGPGGSRELFVPGARTALPVLEARSRDDMTAALIAGRTCSACRHFDYAGGQRKFQQEKLGQAIVRELAWNPEWWNPADYGGCKANPRDATHKDASCPSFEPQGKIASFLGVFKRK